MTLSRLCPLETSAPYVVTGVALSMSQKACATSGLRSITCTRPTCACSGRYPPRGRSHSWRGWIGLPQRATAPSRLRLGLELIVRLNAPPQDSRTAPRRQEGPWLASRRPGHVAHTLPRRGTFWSTRSPETHYAKKNGVHIAYQVVGEGDLDLLLVGSWFSHVEARWDIPGVAHYLRRLASFSRLDLLRQAGDGLVRPDRARPAASTGGVDG